MVPTPSASNASADIPVRIQLSSYSLPRYGVYYAVDQRKTEMPLIRKRRADPDPSTPESSAHQRRRQEAEADADADSSPADNDSGSDVYNEEEDDGLDVSGVDVMVKKMVRLALSTEYSRQVIRRTDISAKVLGEQGTRLFKVVFEGAQKLLRERFGMQMVELPAKEKVTISQRRAAQRVEKPSSSNKTWILNSTLPPAFRVPEILPPTKAPMEGTYTGIYSFIIAVILLNGGVLQESKLERYLKRTNADTYTPIDRTDRLLQRLCKEGYLIRNREMDGGEEIIEYIVGPRGKMEVGARGVAGLVREVYGRTSGGGENMTISEREQMEEFESRLSRSLGLKMEPSRSQEDDPGESSQGGRQLRRNEDEDSDD